MYVVWIRYDESNSEKVIRCSKIEIDWINVWILGFLFKIRLVNFAILKGIIGLMEFYVSMWIIIKVLIYG
jgi:hypothetical protein